MKTILLLATFVLSFTVARAEGHNGQYFPIKEGATRDVLDMYNMCLQIQANAPESVRKHVQPDIYCLCMTDLMRYNFRTTGKAVPTEPGATTCINSAEPEKGLKLTYYFSLVEGGTGEVNSFYNACIEAHADLPVEKRKKVEPTIFCHCLTDLARLKHRSSGKMTMPSPDDGAICRSYASTEKK